MSNTMHDAVTSSSVDYRGTSGDTVAAIDSLIVVRDGLLKKAMPA